LNEVWFKSLNNIGICNIQSGTQFIAVFRKTPNAMKPFEQMSLNSLTIQKHRFLATWWTPPTHVKNISRWLTMYILRTFLEWHNFTAAFHTTRNTQLITLPQDLKPHATVACSWHGHLQLTWTLAPHKHRSPHMEMQKRKIFCKLHPIWWWWHNCNA
jgi:hypothetical protein